MEDLLIALAERRSFPETRFLVARGIVGETWSTQSAAGPESVLVLPVKEPGEGRRDGDGVGTWTETEVPRRDPGLDGLLIPACFAMQEAAPITEITQAVDFTPALTKPAASTGRRCQN